MKFFLKKLFIYLGIVAFICTILQLVISWKIKGLSVLKNHDNFHVRYPYKTDLIFLGSSRCLAHFDPVLYDSAYTIKSLNLGVDGHSELEMHILKLESFLRNNQAPKVVLVNFDVFITAGSGSSKNYTHKDYFARYAFLPFSEEPSLAKYFNYNFAEEYFPCYALFRYKKIFDALFVNNAKIAGDAYERHNEKWDTFKSPVQQIVINNFQTEQERAAIKVQLEKLWNICLEHHMHLILVQTPLYMPAYGKTNLKIVRDVAEQSGIPFFDMNVASINSDVQNFYNSNHLNSVGVSRLFNYMSADSQFTKYLKSCLAN